MSEPHADALARRAQILAALPSPDRAAVALRDIVEAGMPDYCEPRAPFPLPEDLAPELRDELLAWEASHLEAAQTWAEDRFRLGFALGAGLSAELFLDLPTRA